MYPPGVLHLKSSFSNIVEASNASVLIAYAIMNVSMETAKRNISEIKEELESLKENVKMVVSLYEMVSKKFNPFMDVTPEEIKEVTDVLRENIHDLERMVQYAIDDLKELYGAPDLDDMISDIGHQEDTNDQ